MKISQKRRFAFSFILAGIALAACGGGGDSSESTTTSLAPTTVATTEAPTTVPETTTTVPVPLMPLTGQPVVDEAIAVRPAIAAKIDNHPDARPQTGLNEADIVYEENVEKWTRFAVVFHSQGSDPVGPLRSGRSQDIDILTSLNRPLFLWSGGTTTRPSSLSYFVLTCHWNEVLLNRNCLFYPASTHCVIKVKRFFAMYRLTAFYLCPYPTTYRRKTLFAQVQCSLLIYSTKDSKLVFQIKICFVWKLNDYIHEARLIISYKIGSQSVIKSTNLEMIPIWICSEKRPMITSPETNS